MQKQKFDIESGVLVLPGKRNLFVQYRTARGYFFSHVSMNFDDAARHVLFLILSFPRTIARRLKKLFFYDQISTVRFLSEVGKFGLNQVLGSH